MFTKWKEQELYQDLNARLILIGIVSSMGALGFGFDNGWWGSALGLSQFQYKYGSYNPSTKKWAIPSNRTSVGTGTGSAGIILGCILAPFVTTILGRKKSFLILSALMVVGVVLEATALTSFWQLVVGRIIVYSGIGLASNLVPMYQSECAPPRVRGAYLALYSFFTSLGSFLSTLTVFLSRSRSDQWQYRVVILCQLFVPLVYVSAYVFIPESPRYLVYQGRLDEAERVMRTLYNHTENISEEVQLLRLQVEEQQELHKAASVMDCFKGTNLRRTICAMGVQILQQAQGVSFIQNFIVVFMQQLGFSDSLRSNVLVTGCGFAVHIITFITFDKMGRRLSLIVGACGLAAMMLGVGGTTAKGVQNLSTSAQNGCVAMLVLWYCIYGITWGPGPWVVAAEVGTGQLRERTLFLASMGSFVTSVPINFVNPYVQKAISGSVTFIYGGFSLIAIAFIWFVLPETKGRSLEELDEMFQAKLSTREFKLYVCTGLGARITKLEAGAEDEENIEKAGNFHEEKA
ncbi:general substrate transporter [Lipomyces orientalis]|uniref:General substrate transporter n=1 Tax=Lipomyces orientalis TaxID=1233043 RepID=A0ACC3TD35_9ASCO